MIPRVAMCPKCGLVERSFGFPCCCKTCDNYNGEYHSWRCPALKIRQQIRCVMCNLVGAARNYKTCCSPCHRSHGKYHSFRCPAFVLAEGSHMQKISDVAYSSDTWAHELGEGAPPPCGGFASIAVSNFMQMNSTYCQTDVLPLTMAGPEERAGVLKVTVGIAESSYCTLPHGKKRTFQMCSTNSSAYFPPM